MSKAVKAVTRVVSKVVSGATKILSKAAGVVKDVASSKFGRIVLTAAAIYFGGAALAGGFGSSAAGGSFLSGMGTGVANAASSLSTAWGSAMAGEFGQAGSALASGFQGQAAGGMSTSLAGAGGASAGATTGATTQAGVGSTMGGAGGISGSASTIAPTVGTTGAATGTGSIVGSAGGAGAGAGAASGNGIAQGLIGAAKIQAGTALAGNLIQGYGAQKATEDQREYEAQQAALARDRYNANVGANLWSTSQPTQQPGLVAGAMSPYDQLMASIYGPRKV